MFHSSLIAFISLDQYLTPNLYNMPNVQKYALFLLLSIKRDDCLFVCFFVALRPMSTAMVIAGRSVHLTTLFPGQA